MCMTSASVRPTRGPSSRLICWRRQPDIGAHSINRRSPPEFGTFATLRTCQPSSHRSAASPVDYGECSATSDGSALGPGASACLWHGHVCGPACAGPPMSPGKQSPDIFPNLHHSGGKADTPFSDPSTCLSAPAAGQLSDSQTGDTMPRFHA